MFHKLKENCGCTRWRLLCFIMMVLIIIIVNTYKLGQGNISYLMATTLSNHLHTTTVINSTYKFTYSDKLVYSAIVEARWRNCVNSSRNRHITGLCDIYKKCNNYTVDMSQLTQFNFSSYGNLSVSDTDEPHGVGICARRHPKAVIIGIYKSGTRALIDFLTMNPRVVIKRHPHYEVSYFDKYVDKGDEWYKEQMPYSLTDQITIEKSPGYFSSEQTPRRLHEFNRDLKLILIVRNPIDRAISHLTFEKYIIRKKYDNNVYNCIFKYNLLRNRTILNQDCFAVKGSIYDEPMERYLKYFPLEQMHIVDAAQLQQEPCRVLKQVQKYLSLEDYIHCDDFVYNKNKQTFCVKNLTVANSAVCYSETRGRQILKYEDIRQELYQYLKPHNERFFKLIVRKFNWE